MKEYSIETWQKILNHRFIIEFSEDNLPVNKFLFYLEQDHYFLEEFSKFLQSAKQKTTNDEMKEWLGGLYLSTVDFEMEMQRQILNNSSAVLLSSSSFPNTNTATSADAKHNIIPSKTTLITLLI